MKKSRLESLITAALLGTAVLSGAAFAKGPPPGKGPGVEGTGNNLSYPVIWSDGVTIEGWTTTNPSEEGTGNDPATWLFYAVTDPATQCFSVATATTIPAEEVCYWADDGDGIAEQGEVWWLQARASNQWQAYNPTPTSLVAVTGIDWSDDLESRTNLSANSVIRTEVVLLQDVTGATDAGNFLAFNMSGALAATSGASETQGTDYGVVEYGTQTLVDPTTVPPAGYHATVYSGCARYIIQKKTGPSLNWNSEEGFWTGEVNAPVFNCAVYDTACVDGKYAAEINVGGRLLYGYNWNVRNVGEGAGEYRITFVLDGGGCPELLNTAFVNGTTSVVNVGGTAGSSGILYQGDEALSAGEGGLTYMDVTLKANQGGGGGNKGPRQ